MNKIIAVICALTLAVGVVVVTAPRSEASSASGSQIVSTAQAQIGKGYQWGATGPSRFDCSGLVNYVLRQHGINPPRTSAAIQSWATPISKSQLRPGDLVFKRYSKRNGSAADHVSIYAGNGQTVGTSTSLGRVVQRTKIGRAVVGYGRVPGVRVASTQGNVTRAQAARIVADELELANRRNPFGVTTEGGAVGAVFHNRIGFPYSDGLWRPHATITNRQIDLWMARANVSASQEARIRSKISG